MKPGSLTMNRDDGDFTKEQLDAETIGRNYDWKSREIPSNYDPVQLDTFDPPARFIDWWNTRSTFLCCLFPCLSCISSHKTFDGTDPTVWKKQLENPNKGVPESMQGLWWLKDNVAHEQLMTIFGDADFVGTYNEDGTDGYGMWYRPFRHNWTRENSMFGHVLGVNGNRGNIKVSGRMNLKDGILTVHTGLGDGNQIVYKVNDEEWWKVHYAGNPGEALQDEIIYMYKWLKVLDKDGKQTKHWKEYVDWSNAPLPNQNCGTSWFPCWSCCLPRKKALENMVYPNKTQIVNFKH